jgi:hypothetical protein
MLTVLLAAALQQAPPPSVARLDLVPAEPTVQVGDTIRLRATAYDSAGRVVPGVRLRWFGEGEGGVDSTGRVVGGATGVVQVRVVASVPGGRPSRPAHAMVRVVPGPPARVTVTPSPSRLLAGQRLKLDARVFAANGDRRYDEVEWRSSNPRVAAVEPDGRLRALAPGRATLSVSAGAVRTDLPLTVVPNTVRRLEITGGPGEVRAGDVARFGVVARDARGRAVRDVTPQWTMAGGEGLIEADGAFVAYHPGTYVVSAAFGDRTVETTVRVRYRDVRRPVRTVGRLTVPRTVAEFWPHPDGRHAYVTTTGADRVYALDISDPATLRITDSIVVDARVINDFMTTADGRWGVGTREGASSRRNGIFITDLGDPAHPRIVAEYTETVTGGVHSAYVYTQERYGTHAYITDDATGSLRVIDLNDPLRPREIARWQTDRPQEGRYLHDVDVRDGLAYLSYWDDGLVILDVGNGIRGGSPADPVLVSQAKYDLNDLYRRVEEEGGPGFTRGTHTAWRRGHHVFVGDEVYPGAQAGTNRMFGRLSVIDVSDYARPRVVAWYEPEDAGVHNVWIAGDTLYLGAYQGGLRVLDISGELRGDLLAQGREMAWVATGDGRGLAGQSSRGAVINQTMAWGAFYHNGLVWVNDMFNGLWAIRLEPRRELRQAPAVP